MTTGLLCLTFLVLGYLGGRYIPIGLSGGLLHVRWWGSGAEGTPLDYTIHTQGFARDDSWLADQLRQIADHLDGASK